MKRFSCIAIFYFCFLISCPSITLAHLGEEYRPDPVVSAVEEAIQKVRARSPESSKEVAAPVKKFWYVANGTSTSYLHISPIAILQELAQKKPAKDIYLMDVGAANATWSENIENFIHDQLSQSGKHFHIISLTGGQELAHSETVTRGNVTQYRLNHFKIENMTSELIKRDLGYLVNQVDLMIASFTLTHLVDPFGTLTAMYSHLNPKRGVLLAGGFAYHLYHPETNRHRTILSNTATTIGLFAQSSAQFIFISPRGHRLDTEDLRLGFMLIRTTPQELKLPLRYTGNVSALQGEDLKRHDIHSGHLCQYTRTTPTQDHPEISWDAQGEIDEDGLRCDFYGTRLSFDAFNRFEIKNWAMDAKRVIQQERYFLSLQR